MQTGVSTGLLKIRPDRDPGSSYARQYAPCASDCSDFVFGPVTKKSLLLKALQDTGTVILHTADSAISLLNSQTAQISLPRNISDLLQMGTR